MNDPGQWPIGSRYLVHQTIGSGPFGRVWRGSRRADGTPVAVKILNEELSSNLQLVTRFLQERPRLTNIAHPNLVKVHDIVIEHHRIAVVMDLAEGLDLRAFRERSGTPPTAFALQVAADVLSGLEAIHRQGIVHGDLKPENVFLSEGSEHERAAISEAGVAWIVLQEAGRPAAIPANHGYLAPEVIGESTPSPASDLYATGALLYELLSGHEPTPSVPPPGAPDGLWSVLRSLLAEDPLRRPESAQVAKEHLLSVQSGSQDEEKSTLLRGGPLPVPVATDSAADPAPPRAAPWLLAGLAALVVILTVAAVVLIWPGRDASSSLAYTSTPLRQADGLAVARVIELSGDGGERAKVAVTVTNDTSGQFTGTYDEVLPKSLATSADEVVFRPNYAELIQRDPVVRYRIEGLEPGSAFQLAYEVTVPARGLSKPRLETWSMDQERDIERHFSNSAKKPPARLVDIQVPESVRVRLRGALELSIAGTFSDGTVASDAVLSGLPMASSDRSRLDVRGSTVIGKREGTATVTIQAGRIMRSVQVTVTP